MATTSQVKAGLDDIARDVRASRDEFERGRSFILGARTRLNEIPTRYADVIQTIDGYTGANAFETLSQAEKAEIQSEFVTLIGEIEAALDALGVTYN